TTMIFAGPTGPFPGGSVWRIEKADEDGLMLTGLSVETARAVLTVAPNSIRFVMKERQDDQAKELIFRRCAMPSTQPGAPAASQTPPAVSGQESQPKLHQSARPSFDCRRNLSFAEKAICDDAQLSSQDRQLTSLYNSLRRNLSSGAAAELRDGQREWLKLRAS